jgi:1-acyl-sn-glycerol-3-phosphate acyltransferase
MAKGNEIFYDFMIKAVGSALYFPCHYRINLSGKENLPKGKAIIAANHASYTDPIFLTAGSGKRIYYLSKHFAEGTGYSHITFHSLLMKGMGHILLEKEKFEKRHREQILDLLKEEKYLCMFPEGTRSYDGKILDFKEGLTFFSYLSKAPIIPAAIKGSRKVWARGKLLPKLYGNIEIIIGKPIPAPKTKEEMINLTGVVKQEIERLYYSE